MENIKAGYRATGLIPYHPQHIYDKIAKTRPSTPPEQIIDELIERTEQNLNIIRRLESFIKDNVEDVPKKQILLNKL